MKANCFAIHGHREDADEYYRRASEHSPAPDADLLYSWGLTLEALGKQAEAVEVYRHAAIVDPNDPQIQRRLASLTQQTP